MSELALYAREYWYDDPKASMYGMRPASPDEIKAAVAQLDGVEKEWICHYPEFNDEGCLVQHDPDSTRMPRKHQECRWVLAIPLEESHD